jgi:(p)ppGpp synthase/HD superfamily hydrolase
MSVILNAARIACHHHRDQKRDNSGRPYDTHLIKVAGRVATRSWASEEDVATGYLHDIDEDICHLHPELRDTIHTEIINACGITVLKQVIMLTNPSLGSKAPREERKKMDRMHMKHCPQNIKGIKLIDRDENIMEFTTDLRCGFEKRIDFLQKYCDESMLLLNEALRGADHVLEVQLYDSIQILRKECAARK